MNNSPAQLFRHVLASGPTLTQEQTDSLQTLLSAFPQSGVLHAIKARTGLTVDVNRAAAWFGNSEVLQKIVEAPDGLAEVNPAQVIVQRIKPVVVAEPEPEQAIVIDEPEPLESEARHSAPSTEDDDEMPGDIAGGRNFARFREVQVDDTEKLVFENLAANDYFMFDKAVNRDESLKDQATPKRDAYHTPRQQSAPQPQEAAPAPEEPVNVTRYHDDQLPYSFLWWLDKTRNKHSGVYQPFADPKRHYRNPPPGYYQPESIPVPQENKKEELLDRFIEVEPQHIKPPTSDKLANDDKAKQSADDQEGLITETLARIYADQMLYSKAIAAYKILMLKNPEKRRYFAGQIEVLEKKIN